MRSRQTPQVPGSRPMDLSPRGSKYRIFKDSLIPNTIKGKAFGPRCPKYWVLGPCGSVFRALRPCRAEHCDMQLTRLGSQSSVGKGPWVLCTTRRSMSTAHRTKLHSYRPEGPSTQKIMIRTQVPNIIKVVTFGPRSHEFWVIAWTLRVHSTACSAHGRLLLSDVQLELLLCRGQLRTAKALVMGHSGSNKVSSRM